MLTHKRPPLYATSVYLTTQPLRLLQPLPLHIGLFAHRQPSSSTSNLHNGLRPPVLSNNILTSGQLIPLTFNMYICGSNHSFAQRTSFHVHPARDRDIAIVSVSFTPLGNKITKKKTHHHQHQHHHHHHHHPHTSSPSSSSSSSSVAFLSQDVGVGKTPSPIYCV